MEERQSNDSQWRSTVSGGVHESSAHGVGRTLQALTLLGRSTQGLTITQMAIELGTSRQAVYRLVAALQTGGFAFRGNDGKVRLGLGVLDLARQVYPVLRSVATPILRGLAEQTLATAHLTVVSNGEGYALAVEAPTSTDMHLAYRVGAVHSLERGAAGRAILAWRQMRSSVDTGEGREGVTRADSNSLPWVTSYGEFQAGAHGIACAIRGVPGLEASIGVVCLAELNEEVIGPLVVNASDELARLLLQ